MFIHGRKGREKHLIFVRCRFDNLWMEWTCTLYKRGIVSMFFCISSFLLFFSFLLCLLFYYIFPIWVNVLFVCNYSLYKVCKLKIQGNICMRARVHIYVYIIHIHVYIYIRIIYIYMHTCTDVCTYFCAYFIFF